MILFLHLTITLFLTASASPPANDECVQPGDHKWWPQPLHEALKDNSIGREGEASESHLENIPGVKMIDCPALNNNGMDQYVFSPGTNMGSPAISDTVPLLYRNQPKMRAICKQTQVATRQKRPSMSSVSMCPSCA